jgi:hypothetical protein
MIYQELYLPKYDWRVQCFFAVDGYYLDDIMEKLWEIGCDSSNAQTAYENISSNELNTGLCYSNLRGRESIIVTAITTTAAEFAHSFVHEITHCATHIAQASNIDFKSEEFCYLAGDLAKLMHPYISKLLCSCCRNPKKYDRYE